MGGCRVHGVSGCSGVGGGGVHGRVVGGFMGGCIYLPTHEQLQCQNISFYEHLPTHQTYPKCHSATIHVLWMVHGVSGGWWLGGWRVHGVGEWVVMGCMVGWVVGELMGWVHILTHP